MFVLFTVLGASSAGVPVVLGLDGAHLYVSGPRGSGRSALLRAAVSGLLTTQSPQDLNIVLLDASGDETFTSLSSAPHVLASVGRDTLFTSGRLQLALRGELDRRVASGSSVPLVVFVDRFDLLSQDWQDLLWSFTAVKADIHVVMSGGPGSTPIWLDRVVSLQSPGNALLNGTEFTPAQAGGEVREGVAALEFVQPPLTSPITLSTLSTHAHSATDRHGSHGEISTSTTDEGGALSVPIGLVDDPYAGGYSPLRVDLSALDGHMVVVGAHGSGKSTLLRTLVTSLALHHTTSEVQVYGLDFTGGALETLHATPHCRAMVPSTDSSLLWHVNEHLGGLLARRMAAFRAAGVHSVADYRPLGTVEEPGDVVVVIDGWPGAAHNEFLRWHVVDLISRGADFGVHVVLTASRWSELAPEFAGAFGTRLELTLTDPSTSFVDPYVRHPGPGHGVDASGKRFLVAQDSGVHDWQQSGVAPPKIRSLPDEVLYTSIGSDDKRIPIGLTAGDQTVAYAGDTQHFLCFGDNDSGRSAVVRAYLSGLVTSTTPKEAMFLLADMRRANLGEEWGEHRLAYTRSGPEFTDMMKDVESSLRKRLGATWTGPQLHLVVDDYDDLGTPNPLHAILDLLPHAKQIGLHVVLTSRHRRPTDAVHRAFDPQQTKVLMLSGTAEGPEPISGLTPAAGPPGRGVLSGPGGQQTIQVGWVPPRF